MARPLRLEYPGAFYHVINRGNAREKIFKSDRDREKFLWYIEQAVERFSIIVHSYCLMSNHYHFLIETPEPNLSRAIQWISTSYVQYFNTKRKRRGHLFQARFKSILIDADEYLTHLSRYIHLNPLRAKMVESLEEYKWSSYSVFIGKSKRPVWLEINWLLSNFGKTKKEAYKNYKEFVEGVDIRKIKNPGLHAVNGFILGEPDFVEWVKDTFLSGREDNKEIPQLRKLKPRVSPKTIVSEVGKEYKCDEEDIRVKGRKKNVARDVAIFLSKDNCGIQFKDLGEFFGNVTGSTITMTYNRIAKQIERNKRLKGRVKQLKKRILKI